MGGQQFGEAALLVDTRSLNRVLDFDAERGVITVEGGIQWPQLIDYLNRTQQGRDRQWGIYQKQTGADRLSLAGALSCNAHGRGLNLKPIVQQVEAFDLLGRRRRAAHVLARTRMPTCSGSPSAGTDCSGSSHASNCGCVRASRSGASSSSVRRRTSSIGSKSAFATDICTATTSSRPMPPATAFSVAVCSRATSRSPPDTPLTEHPTRFKPEDWARLTFYSHTHKRRAFEVYSSRYLKTSGQIYWADSQLSAAYVDDYHADLDRAVGAAVPGSEMITEIYVQRPQLSAFMEEAREVLRRRRANVIYGTVRLIEKDDETFLAWARDRYACVIFNLHIEHTPTEDRGGRGSVPRSHRPRHRARRQLLPDLPSLGAARPGGALLSADAGVSGAEAAARSGRTVPEHLVPALPRACSTRAESRSVPIM